MASSSATPIDRLNQDGFLIVRGAAEAATAAELLAAGQALLDRADLKFTDYPSHRNGSVWKCGVVEQPGVRIAVDVLGADPRIDRGVEAILGRPDMKALLEQVLGPDMRLTQVTIREAKRGDRALAYHQDSDGEVGIGILLLDCDDEEGTTSFLRGSHRIPATIRELFVMPRVDTRLVPKGMVSPGAGKAGDAILFYNRTWHARHALTRKPVQCALMMSFFPAGKPYHFHEVDAATLSTLGPTLQQMMRVDDRLQRMPKGAVVYLGQGPSHAETRQILTLDAFGLNRGWRLVLAPLVWLNRNIDTLVRRMAGRHSAA